jgi:hypothetical protein
VSARGELTTLVLGKTAPRAADAILAAGYRKIDPQLVETALRSLISDLDYDIHKELDYDDSYPGLTRNFMRYYEEQK